MMSDCRIGDVFNGFGDILVCREFCAIHATFRERPAGRGLARAFAGAWFRYLVDGVPPVGFDPATLRLLQFGPERPDGRALFKERKAAFLVPGTFVSIWRTIGTCRKGDDAKTEQDAAADMLVAFAWLGLDTLAGPVWWGAVREAHRTLVEWLPASSLVFRRSNVKGAFPASRGMV